MEEVSLWSPIFGYPLNPSTWMNAESIARRVPQLMREIPIDIGSSDKVFSSEWLTETTVLIGTKCNKLLGVDAFSGLKFEVPILRKYWSEVECRTPSSGIHRILTSPGKEYLATGGHAPNYLALYSLPDLIPLSLGEAHTDWIFDVQWLSNNLVITGSRDSSMALWSVPTHFPHEDCPEQWFPQDQSLPWEKSHPLAENVPVMKPIFHFSNSSAEPYDLTSVGDRVRSLAYNEQKYELASLQVSSNSNSSVHFWDVILFEKVSQAVLPESNENVCVEVDADGTLMYAVGSKSHVIFMDTREATSIWSMKSLDPNCGVRSLAFNQQLLSVGTGAGHIYFYDLRTRNWLLDKSGSQPCTLKPSDRWLRYYEDVPESYPFQNAIFTHCYSPFKTKLFSGGGPLLLNMYGNYSSVWI